MTVQEIIEAIKNDNLRGNVPFHFVALDKDKGGVAEYGKSSCLEDEIYMLTLHMEAVRTICERNGKLLGYGDSVNFSDRKEWIGVLAAALYAVYSRRHCVTDVQKLYEDILKVYTMPKMMGKQITDWDVEDLLTKKCGIDWERLEKVVEYAR